MSSSGLIYAFIVGAWAVYLVPMWLRREDELNKARQTQRYTTAIKVLSHKDSFERRYGATAEQKRDEERAHELPVAVGQSGSAPGAGQATLERVKAKDRERAASGAPSTAASGSASTSSARGAGTSGARAATAAASAPASAKPAAPRVKAAFAAESPAGAARRDTVTARVDAANAPSPETSRSARTPGSPQPARNSAVWTPPPASAPTPSAGLGPRSGLRARRRRVVGFLFALTSLGAIVSADLGIGYIWVMLLPAAALSAYIAWVRKDERARAAERARRRAVAAKAARESERRESELRRQQDEVQRLEREELARRNAMARRRTAAARSRAERRTTPGAPNLPDQGDLPRAANS